MTIKVTQKYTRQTGRKVRLVANTVRKLPLEEALRQLAVIERRSTLVIMKTVKQAIANAINNHGLKFADLKLDNIIVNDGPQYRRMRAVSRGRGHEVRKRTSHVTVTLSTIDTQSAKAQVKPVVATPDVKVEPVAEKKVANKKTSKTEVKTAVKPAKKTAAAKKDAK